MELQLLTKEDLKQFKDDIQEAFQLGFEEVYGKTDGIILPEADIDESLNTKGAISYKVVINNNIVGGAVVVIDEETGDVKTKTRFRIILFGADGKTYVSAAYGVYNSLRQILPIFGNPSKDNPITVKVGTRKLRSGKESLVLTVVK